MDYLEIKKIFSEVIYDSVNKIVDKRIRELSFNYCVEGQIQQINKDPRDISKIKSYEVLIHGNKQTVYAKNNEIYKVGDVVLIEVVNNNYSQKYISFKKP